MNRNAPINQRQVEVLRWIADGCPDGVMTGYSYKTTARALQGRNLVKAGIRGGAWRAEVTEAGRHYLAYGRFPADMREKPGTPRPAAPDQTPPAPTQGVPPPGSPRTAKESLARPIGGAAEDPVVVQPVPVPEQVLRLHSVASQYRKDPDRQEVSGDLLARATRIVHAVATEAQRRGYLVAVRPSPGDQYDAKFLGSLRDGQFTIEIDGFRYGLRIREEPGRGAVRRTYDDRNPKLPRWLDARQFTFIPTGRLEISIASRWQKPLRTYGDTKSRTLEDFLPDLMRQLEATTLEDARKREEEKREAEAKRRRWEQAMDRARHDFRQATLAQELTSQLALRRLVGEIDGYLAGLRSAMESVGEEQQFATGQWISWIAEYRDKVDPLRHRPSTPSIREPSADELRPYLRGWSPYGPEPR